MAERFGLIGGAARAVRSASNGEMHVDAVALAKAADILEWLDGLGPERIKVGLRLLGMLENRLDIVAQALGDPALAAVAAAFPESRLSEISETKPASSRRDSSARS